MKEGDLFVVTTRIYGTDVDVGDYLMYIRTNLTTNFCVFHCVQKNCIVGLSHRETELSIERLINNEMPT